MKLTRSQILLLLASMLTLGLTWQTYQEEASDDIALPTRVLSQAEVKHIGGSEVGAKHDLVVPERPLVPLVGNLFASRQKMVPKPKVALPVYREPPQVVVTPPLPFKYIGRWLDKEKQVVMLDYRGEMVMAKQGDVIANQYKVEAIDELAGRIQVKFLVMSNNEIQTLQARVGQP